MALDAISGAVYQETAKTVQKPKMVNSVQEQMIGTTDMNITEVSGIAKTTSSNQFGKDAEKEQKENSASPQQIKDAISRANNKLKNHRTRCEFSYHEETKRVSIKVLDSDTEEVIKEIPPEETLQMVQKMWELAGILIDEKR